MLTLCCLLLWTVFAFAVGFAAKRRYQRSRVGWIIFALFFSPLFVFLLLVVLGPNPAPPQLRKLLHELEG